MAKKDTFWFKHDYNARNDEKILELRSIHGAEAYGIYWMIIETMADSSNGGMSKFLLGGISQGFGILKPRLVEILKCCIEVGLFYEEEDFYYSNRLLKHKKERELFSDMGYKGFLKREENKKNKGGLREAYGGLKGGLSEERRGEEKRIKGVSFFENKFAVFPDGEKQPLGKSQLFRLENNDLKPSDVLKGVII
jgi:hypothetical protein